MKPLQSLLLLQQMLLNSTKLNTFLLFTNMAMHFLKRQLVARVPTKLSFHVFHKSSSPCNFSSFGCEKFLNLLKQEFHAQYVNILPKADEIFLYEDVHF